MCVITRPNYTPLYSAYYDRSGLPRTRVQQPQYEGVHGMMVAKYCVSTECADTHIFDLEQLTTSAEWSLEFTTCNHIP